MEGDLLERWRSELSVEGEDLSQLHALAAGLGPLEQRLQHHVIVGVARDQDLLLLNVALDVRHTCHVIKPQSVRRTGDESKTDKPSILLRMRVQALEQPSHVMPTLNSVTLVILAAGNLESELLSRVPTT